MESLAPLLPLGRLLKREFQRQFRVRWIQSLEDWDTLILFAPWLRLSTTQWLDSEWILRGVPIVLPPPEAEMFADASVFGWGDHISHLS
jgi:hypothetical protein